MPIVEFKRLYWIAVLLYSGFVIALLATREPSLGYSPETNTMSMAQTVYSDD